jgi:hypothetical protein
MRKIVLFFALLLSAATGQLNAQCNSVFYDGFESGSYTPTWSIGTGLTSGAVTTTNPYSGVYRLEGTGGTSAHLTGFSTTIAASTPNYISWDVFPTGTGASNYMVAGNSSITATNCIMFCYWQGGTNLRFVSSSTAIFTCAPNAWHHIEMRNVNFTTHTFDIWIDNTLVQANFPFRSATQNNISKIHLYNFNSAVGVWDNISIGLGTSPILTSVSTPVNCNGGNDGAIDLSVTGGAPGYTYNWSTADTSQDISSLSAGSYSVTVTDITPCTATTTIVITEPTPIDFGVATETDAQCHGGSDGSIAISPSGGTPGYTYQWSNGDTAQNPQNLMAGSYLATVTDTHGCTATDTFAVDEPAAIVVTDSTLMPNCNGNSNGAALATVFGGTGFISYLWSTGDTFNTISNIPAGIYTVSVTDSLGCTGSDTVIVSEPALIDGNPVVTNLSCFGDNSGAIDLTPSGGTPGFTFFWSNGDTTEDVSNLPAGNYFILITDQNGCPHSDSINVTQPNPISASSTSSGDTGTGNGAIDLTVSGGTPPYTYIWSNGNITEDPVNLSAGNYTVTITDANGCTQTESVTVALITAMQSQLPVSATVYPNPFQNRLNVVLTGISTAPVQLKLTDIQGRMLWGMEAIHDQKIEIDEKMPAGIYFLHLVQEGGTKTIKLAKE